MFYKINRIIHELYYNFNFVVAKKHPNKNAMCTIFWIIMKNFLLPYTWLTNQQPHSRKIENLHVRLQNSLDLHLYLKLSVKLFVAKIIRTKKHTRQKEVKIKLNLKKVEKCEHDATK